MTDQPQFQFSRRERQIMDALYGAGELSAADVRASIDQPPSYSAVRALLSKLVEKGAVSFRQQGKSYIYRPVVAQEQAQSSALSRLVKTFFGGSAAGAASALLGMNDKQLSDAEIDQLEDAIAQARANRQGQKSE